MVLEKCLFFALQVAVLKVGNVVDEVLVYFVVVSAESVFIEDLILDFIGEVVAV